MVLFGFFVSINQPKFMVSNNISPLSEGTYYPVQQLGDANSYQRNEPKTVLYGNLLPSSLSLVVDSFRLKLCLERFSFSEGLDDRQRSLPTPNFLWFCVLCFLQPASSRPPPSFFSKAITSFHGPFFLSLNPKLLVFLI